MSCRRRGLGREKTQTARIDLPGNATFAGDTTKTTQEYEAPEIVISTDKESGCEFYAGVADDPFFLDDTGANVWSVRRSKIRAARKQLPERARRTRYLCRVQYPDHGDQCSGHRMLKGEGNVIGINAVTQRRATQTIGADGSITGSGEWVTVDRDGAVRW